MIDLRLRNERLTKPVAGEADSGQLEVRWVESPDDHAAMVELRRIIFREEQRLADLTLTDPDESRSHAVIALVDGRPVGTGRLTFPHERKHAYISWVATLKAYRNQGIGGAMMRVLMESADSRRFETVVLSAQAHAISFYRAFGFVPIGSPFEVRGIPHQTMLRHLPPDTR
jgi:predicted GNAT family N-acyltransferase